MIHSTLIRWCSFWAHRRCISTLLILTNAVAVAALASDRYQQQQNSDLQRFAVKIVNSVPFRSPLSGYGVYLGNGVILTAAHVLGRWTILENPRVEIANKTVSAQIIRKGSFPNMDLALLAVDKAAIPSLQLWLNPLCRSVVPVGAPVIVVYPDRTIPSRTVSPQLIAPKYRAKFDTLISEPEVSGSGLYDLQKRCLLGIMSAAIVTAGLGPGLSRVGYFVPSSKISAFIAAKLSP